jgi:catechol 2,3-dioxygenase-like lactoylglutathione lyase family enzyme
MIGRIDLITLVTARLPEMLSFYRDVLGFGVKTETEQYVEFESPGVRFSLTTREVMAQATNHPDFARPRQGQAVELAFRVATPGEVDTAYASLIARGAQPITPPADMPWGQRTAFFADPEGNIHELFADFVRSGPA